MPTGYTADVGDGKLTEFSAFAMRCARAFGALIELRDERMDAPIPEAFEPSSYHVEAGEKARAEVVRLAGLPLEERYQEWRDEVNQRIQDAEESDRRQELVVARYREMRDKVMRWVPPTPEHDGLKQFMIQQLDESIRFDGPVERKYRPTVYATVDEWYAAKVTKAKRDVDYHAEGLAKDKARAAERTKWIADLRKSLATPELASMTSGASEASE